MNDKKITPQIIDELIDSASSFEVVDTPPFFKDRVLHRLSKAEDNEVSYSLNWFGPRFQWAALVVFIMLNFGVLYYYNSAQQEQELQSFAETYGLSSAQNNSILN